MFITTIKFGILTCPFIKIDSFACLKWPPEKLQFVRNCGGGHFIDVLESCVAWQEQVRISKLKLTLTFIGSKGIKDMKTQSLT